MKTVGIGGRGLAGSPVMTVLRRDGHEVAAAPSQGCRCHQRQCLPSSRYHSLID
jgi:prephenate dehydrogenase